MIKIDELKDNLIDLGGIKEYNVNFSVDSYNANGKRQPFFVERVSSKDISVSIFAVNSINISINVKNIVNDEFIVLKNIINERLVINIKPNNYYSDDRVYKFKISKQEERENGEIRIRLLSKVNKDEIGWKCTYDGRPMSYTITPMESNKSGYVTIRSNMNMVANFTSLLIFTQDESNEEIRFKILNTPEGMKLIDKAD